ncbi:MAG: ANTAR domain-containing protein [Candidatus Izemoplasma sp.]
MKVAVIKSNTFLDDKVKRIFELGNIKVDIIDKVTQKSLNEYQTIIFSNKNKINNIHIVMENIVVAKRVLVVYINNTPNIGQFHNLLNSELFINIEERKIDTSLLDIIKISNKYLLVIESFKEELDKLKQELIDDKIINRAKFVLISKGLTEANSHKLIQKTAMNFRVSKSEAANLIIKNKIDIQ